MNTPNNLEWVDEVLNDYRGQILTYEQMFRQHHHDPERLDADKQHARAVAKQTIATKLEEIRSEERIKCQELVNIEALISNREKLSRLERGIYELERLQYIPQMFGDWENVIDDRIATLRKELEAEL